jgi:hypothetical protein
MKCPECNSEQLASESCVDCGIIFSKYEELQERKKREKRDRNIPRPYTKPEAADKASLNFNLDTLQGITLGIALLLVALKSIFVEFDAFSLLLLVPFYVCCVSAVSGFCGDALYIYNKWETRFEPYEGRWRLAYIGFFSVFSLVFAWMYFKLTRFL